MSRLPRIYAESTIKRMRSKLELPEETVGLLYDYFEAFANFYELMPLRDAYTIINKYDKGLVTKEEFIAFSEIARHEHHYYCILGKEEQYIKEPKSEPIDREIVHESLVMYNFECYYETEENQRGKPLYVPPKDELLKYSDDLYIEKNKCFKELKSFFKNRLKFDNERADESACDCISLIRVGSDYMDSIFNLFGQMGIRMSEEQAEEFIELLFEANNNTRLPSNRGFTPNELSMLYRNSKTFDSVIFDSDMRSAFNTEDYSREFIQGTDESNFAELLDGWNSGLDSSYSMTFTTGKKIGRNDPCPCGSGKKYKKCCGK